jgi:hypothetical protein
MNFHVRIHTLSDCALKSGMAPTLFALAPFFNYVWLVAKHTAASVIVERIAPERLHRECAA